MGNFSSTGMNNLRGNPIRLNNVGDGHTPCRVPHWFWWIHHSGVSISVPMKNFAIWSSPKSPQIWSSSWSDPLDISSWGPEFCLCRMPFFERRQISHLGFFWCWGGRRVFPFHWWWSIRLKIWIWLPHSSIGTTAIGRRDRKPLLTAHRIFRNKNLPFLHQRKVPGLEQSTQVLGILEYTFWLGKISSKRNESKLFEVKTSYDLRLGSTLLLFQESYQEPYLADYLRLVIVQLTIINPKYRPYLCHEFYQKPF